MMIARKRNPVTKIVPLHAKRARRLVVRDLVIKVKAAQAVKPNSSGAERIIDENKLIYPWLTRNMVYGSLRRLKSNEQSDVQTAIVSVAVNNQINVSNINGGRPTGSTDKHIQLSLDLKDRAKDEMAILYDAEKKQNGGSLKRGSFKKIHQSVVQKLGINDLNFKVSVKSIQSRVYRNSLTVNKSLNQPIPTHAIEKVLLQVSMWKQEAGQPISVSEGLDLANSLIDGKPMQNDLKIFQESKKKSPSGLLSRRYWRQFMKRHSKQLEAAKGHLVATNRTEWVTFDNIDRMYDLVYDQMVASGVARRLSPAEHYWVDKHGETIESESDACGLKVEIEITHPEWILFGDEVGTDISQKDDGHVGGQKFVTAKGTRANIKSSHADGRFTAIGLTAASGDPVMAIVIFAAKELSFIQRMGHDITVEYDETISVTENSGVGKAFPGGPTCIFRGKTIPALITCSPKGSISSSILREAFQRLDDLGVYERTPNLNPFALFDAHDSCLQVPFLWYINDPTHRWTFCIGLPNGTHKWQVGDSKEQNGSYKIEWTRQKTKLVLWRTRMGLASVLEKSDILPLFNRVWNKSFARVYSNKKAIRDRGWYPANKMLLTDPEILKTKVADPTSNAIVPADHSNAIVPADHSNAITPVLDPPPTNTLAVSLRTDDSLTTASGFASTSLSTINTELVESPWVDLTDMNFDKGLAGEFTIDIMQHMVRNKKVSENLNTRYENGRTTRCQIDTQRRLTGGSLFDANHIVMDEEVLRIRESKEQDKMDEKEAIVSKAIQRYHSLKEAYLKVVNSSTEETDFKGAHFKAVIHFKKQKNDKPVPTRVADLKVRYEEVKNRSEWSIKQYLTDRELCNEGEEYLEIVERLLVPATVAMVPLVPVRLGQSEVV